MKLREPRMKVFYKQFVFTFSVMTLLVLLTHVNSFAFDMARDANAKEFTKKTDHTKDDKRPVTNLKMKRPADYPGNVVTDVRK
jgi:hypothetical protein